MRHSVAPVIAGLPATFERDQEMAKGQLKKPKEAKKPKKEKMAAAAVATAPAAAGKKK